MFEESVSSVPSIWATVNNWFTPTVLFVLLNLMIGTIAITSSLNRQNNQHEQEQQQQHARHLARSPSMLQRLKSINFYSYRSHEPNTAFERPVQAATYEGQGQQQQQPLFTRSPSMLQRLKSLKFYSYIPPEPTLHAQKPEETDTLLSFQQAHEEKAAKSSAEEAYDRYEEEDEDVQEHEMTLDEVYSKLKSGQVNRTKSDTEPASGKLPTKLPNKMKKSASAKSAFSHFQASDVIEARRPATVREGAVEPDEEVDAKADDFINKFKQQLKLQRIDSIMRYKELITRGTGK